MGIEKQLSENLPVAEFTYELTSSYVSRSFGLHIIKKLVRS